MPSPDMHNLPISEDARKIIDSLAEKVPAINADYTDIEARLLAHQHEERQTRLLDEEKAMIAAAQGEREELTKAEPETRGRADRFLIPSLMGAAALGMGLDFAFGPPPSGPIILGGYKHATPPRTKPRSEAEKKFSKKQKAARKARNRNRK